MYAHLRLVVHLETGARGDEVAEDHVLLQAHQVIDLADQRRLGRTFVVSWKLAALMKLSDCTAAFVMPKSCVEQPAGCAASQVGGR